jgi:hypothetical protein
MTLRLSLSKKTIFADGGDCLNQRRRLALRMFSPSVGDISGDVFQRLRVNGPRLGLGE